jgi:hypothetical protein
MDPVVEQLTFPEGYGTPTATLDWAYVRDRLESAERYWLATTRPDGRPHVIPIDGVWVDGAWYFGGHSDTVHQRTLLTNPEVAVHLEDSIKAVIAEGRAEWVELSPEDSARVAKASNDKYGYGFPADSYAKGVWRLRPARVLAWDALNVDATRFRFVANS